MVLILFINLNLIFQTFFKIVYRKKIEWGLEHNNAPKKLIPLPFWAGLILHTLSHLLDFITLSVCILFLLLDRVCTHYFNATRFNYCWKQNVLCACIPSYNTDTQIMCILPQLLAEPLDCSSNGDSQILQDKTKTQISNYNTHCLNCSR